MGVELLLLLKLPISIELYWIDGTGFNKSDFANEIKPI